MRRVHLPLLFVVTLGLLLPGLPGGSQAAAQAEEYDVLFFHRTTGFRHDSIPAALAAVEALGAEHGFSVTETQEASIFTDGGLEPFEAIVFYTDGENTLNADQRRAFERYTHRGGGYVGLHSASNMDKTDWPWYADLLGDAFFQSHPSGDDQFQQATVRVEETNHPSTAGLPAEWVREDEWYNFTANPRDKVHVLATLDESTYNPGPDAMGDDHPIAWCSNFDRGRVWYTAMGHKSEYYDEPLLRGHILGGIQWAAGVAEGECGEPREGIPTDASFEKVALDDNTANPMELAVAPDGRVFYVELAGTVKVYRPDTGAIVTAAQIPVHRGNENGLLGIALDPNFEQNNWLYLFYSAPSPEVQHVSRFTVVGDTLDMDSEQVLLEFPHQREVCCHSAGSMTFGPDGNLYISTGDDTAHFASQGYAPIDGRIHDEHVSEDAKRSYDARRSSGNTNDLRGKILRIRPEPDGTYSIPEGNLFPPGEYPEDLTRPEIYTMGHRNPFRITVDDETGWVYAGEVGPDANSDNPDRGPRGYDEWNQIRGPGNYGWPYCIADSKPYREWDFATETPGELFDCENGPANDSPFNTGLDVVPPTEDAFIWYPYGTSPEFPELPTGSGRSAFAGGVYHYDETVLSDGQFPQYYDDAVFVMEWSRNWIGLLRLDEQGNYAGFEQFMPDTLFRSPHDMAFGPDGNMYLIEWGIDFNYAGENVNPDSGLYRISYTKGARTPVAEASADRDSGPTPLTVNFSSERSRDPDGDELTFLWNFGDGTTSEQANPSHTFTEPGAYTVQLTVTDPTGRSSSSNLTITAGNTRPEVTIETPPHGGFFDWGDDIPFQVSVSDAEDGSGEAIDCERVTVQLGLYHDEGGNAHVHPGARQTGCEGVLSIEPDSGHGPTADVSEIVTASYADLGGEPGAPSLTGGLTHFLQPKLKQAEFHTGSSGLTRVPSGDVEGGADAIVGQDGAFGSYDPVNLHGIDAVTIRVAAAEAGTVELRRDAPDGPLLGTANVPATGGLTRYTDVTVAVDDPGETVVLYLTFPGEGARRVNFLEFEGKGLSPVTRPTVRITSPVGYEPQEVGEIEVTAEASDAENEITQVEFFAGQESIGIDQSAPYGLTWNVAEENLYHLTAVATNDLGYSTTSRIVVVPVGDIFAGGWQVFSNTEASFERPGENNFVITANGANMWQGTDEYGTIYRPAGATGENWTATVRVDSQGNTHDSAKAGLIVRNDVTSPGASPGYAVMAMRAGLGFELLRDTDGDGTLDASTGADTTSYPAWVRIQRRGTTFTGFWSKDGETFTPVASFELPSAATAQDIGMVVTAHNPDGEQSRVEFADFELSLDEDPGEEPVLCPGAGSDEFDGDALDLDRWSEIVRHDPAGYTVSGGTLTLPAAQGDFFGGGPNDNPNLILQPAPGGAWSATTKLTFAPTENYQQAGLLVYGDDANYVKFDYLWANSPTVELISERDDSPAFLGSTGYTDSDTVWLRLRSDGAMLHASYSSDGETFVDLGEPAPLAGIPNPKVGVYANNGNTEAGSPDAGFDFFHLETGQAEVEPSDEFDGDELDLCRWRATVRHDPSGYSVGGGVLTLPTAIGDFFGQGANNNANMILQPAPEGPWTATTKVNYRPVENYEQAGVLVYGDDANYVKADLVHANGRVFEFLRETDDMPDGFGGTVPVSESFPDDWYLRVSSDGSTLTAEFSADGQTWTPFGEPTPLSIAGPEPKIGIYANDGGQPVTERPNAVFDWFRVTVPGEEPDTTAPVTSVATDPAAPDGDNGWFVADPVVVSLTAADEEGGSGLDRTEYRLDAGDWTTYADAVPVAGEGTHTLAYRSVDLQGNVEDAKTLTVRIDPTAPEAIVSLPPAPYGWYQGSVLVTLQAADATSGVAAVEYSLDGGPWTPYPGESVEVRGTGQRELRYRAVDVAGNASAPQSTVVDLVPACTETVTGEHAGRLAVGEGMMCLSGATVRGPVTVGAGAGLVAIDTTFRGRVTASEAGTVIILDSRVRGGLTVTGATDRVQIADTEVAGAVRVDDNLTGTVPLTVSGNTITGTLACSGNEPAPADGDQPNSVTGRAAGQCAEVAVHPRR